MRRRSAPSTRTSALRDALNEADHAERHSVTALVAQNLRPLCGICRSESVRFGAILCGVGNEDDGVVWGASRSGLSWRWLARSFASTQLARAGPAAQGRRHHGKAISYTCLGCHGIEGYKNAYPNYSVPSSRDNIPSTSPLRCRNTGAATARTSPCTRRLRRSPTRISRTSPPISPASRSCRERKPVGTPPAGRRAVRVLPWAGRRHHRPDVSVVSPGSMRITSSAPSRNTRRADARTRS